MYTEDYQVSLEYLLCMQIMMSCDYMYKSYCHLPLVEICDTLNWAWRLAFPLGVCLQVCLCTRHGLLSAYSVAL